MRDHVTGALCWWDFVAATFRAPLDGAVMLENFRAVFAASLGLDASSVTLFGSGRCALHALTAGLDLPPDAGEAVDLFAGTGVDHAQRRIGRHDEQEASVR